MQLYLQNLRTFMYVYISFPVEGKVSKSEAVVTAE